MLKMLIFLHLMKFLFLLTFVAFLAFTPIYLYQQFVEPELNNLANQYRSFDQTAQEIASSQE